MTIKFVAIPRGISNDPIEFSINNGYYNYPISNYGNDFKYILGDFSLSHIDNFSNKLKHFELTDRVERELNKQKPFTSLIRRIYYLPLNIIICFHIFSVRYIIS